MQVFRVQILDGLMSIKEDLTAEQAARPFLKSKMAVEVLVERQV